MPHAAVRPSLSANIQIERWFGMIVSG